MEWREGTDKGVWYSVEREVDTRYEGHSYCYTARYRVDGEEYLVGYFFTLEEAYHLLANDLCMELQLTRNKIQDTSREGSGRWMWLARLIGIRNMGIRLGSSSEK